MALTAQSRNVTTTSPSPAGVDHPFRPRRLTLGVAALVAGMAAASTGLVLASGSSSPARPAETSTSVPPAYAPGGSVYNQQVPALARETESIPVPPAYAPGGSVYNQQVPALGRESESIPVPPAYAPGGSVYNQQVPRP